MLIQILIASILATSAMTLFSYIISESFRELYKEPLLLKFILDRLKLNVSDRLKEILAWFIHYVIGFIFVVCYDFLWKYKIVPQDILTGIYLGAICGIIGIIGWIIMFKLSGFHRKAKDKGYYFQLLFAHVIFGLTAVLSYMYI